MPTTPKSVSKISFALKSLVAIHLCRNLNWNTLNFFPYYIEMVADSFFPSSLVHLKKYPQKATFPGFSLAMKSFFWKLPDNFCCKLEVFGSAFSKGVRFWLGEHFSRFDKRRRCFIVLYIVRLYIVFGNKSSVGYEIIIWTVKFPNIFHPCLDLSRIIVASSAYCETLH